MNSEFSLHIYNLVVVSRSHLVIDCGQRLYCRRGLCSFMLLIKTLKYTLVKCWLDHFVRTPTNMANDAEKGDKGRNCSHSPQCFEKSRCSCPHTSILGQPRLPSRTQGEVWWRKCGATAFAFKDRWLGALGALVTSSSVGLVGQTTPIRRCTAYRSPDRIGQGGLEAKKCD